ncbi:hypothetical protein [Dipodfec virus RodF1_74]|uniref:Uncharacterized protein n=1 Tax=Dipodfec virus RodF1_74 TaxID=2929310 RepID=A0A976N2L2_9VIRU|nr:hypothetical protein [Dipodfec virus RodF1_74]
MTTEQIINLAVAALGVILHIVSAILCTKGIHVLCKHDETNNLKEVEKSTMKTRMPDYRENLTSEKKAAEGQTFTRYVKQYRLNKVTDELEEIEPLDIVQLIQSSLDTCLSASLSRLMPEQPEDSAVVMLDTVRDDLDDLAQSLDIAEEWREKLNLGDDLSVSDVFAKMQEYSETLNKTIKEAKENAQTQNTSTPQE